MNNNIFAFDLATSGNFSNICYGVTMKPEGNVLGHPTHYFSRQEKEGPADVKLHPVQLLRLTMSLDAYSKDGSLFGWGSLGYDCRLLYQEGVASKEVLDIANKHIDLFWQLAIHTGFWISLPEVAQVYGITLDPNMSRQVPQLWNSGDREQQLKVVRHHVNSALAILFAADTVVKSRSIRWIDKKTGKECIADMLPLSNEYYLRNILALPDHALAKTVAEPVRWLRNLQLDEMTMENAGDVSYHSTF